MFWTIFSFTLSSLILGAHFLRSGATLLVLLALGMPFLFFIKKRWVLIFGQVYLYLGAVLWLIVTYNIRLQRIAMGDDWGRMAAILISVAAFTAFSGWLLTRKTITDKYQRPDEQTQMVE